jgi:hypothetical protein
LYTEAVQRAMFSSDEYLPSGGRASRLKALIKDFFAQ